MAEKCIHCGKKHKAGNGFPLYMEDETFLCGKCSAPISADVNKLYNMSGEEYENKKSETLKKALDLFGKNVAELIERKICGFSQTKEKNEIYEESTSAIQEEPARILACGKGGTSLAVEGGSLILISKTEETIIPIRSIQRFSVGEYSFSGANVSIMLANDASSLHLGLGFRISLNTIEFYVDTLEDYHRIKEIEKIVINYGADEKTVAAFSAADEILKFKNLCDMGIISQEEFEAKKKQLLGI